MKKLLTLLFTLFVACSSSAFAGVTIKNTYFNKTVISQPETSGIEYKTLTELASPIVAGPTPMSYYDDGTLYYVHTADTIGYNINHNNIGFEFGLKITSLNSSSWLSLTLKASDCDRTQSPNLTQKGYSILIFNHGLIQLIKDGATINSSNIQAIELNRKYNIKVSAINSGDNVDIKLYINNTEIISYKDSNNAYTGGTWFNICSDGGISAELYTTKKEYIPNYETYTLSTIGNDILTSNNAKVDVNKNVELIGSAGSVGILNYAQNFAFEFKINFSTFAAYNNFWISWRSSAFDRASTSSNTRGYAARICQSGVIEIYKNTILVTSGYYGTFNENQDYIIEICAVDIDSKKTQTYVNVNNQKSAMFIDTSSPIQRYGFICLNNDGNVSCKLVSTSSKLTPIYQEISQTSDDYTINIYFYNVLSYRELNYKDFSKRMLDSILVNDSTIYDLNALYHTASNGNIIDLKFSDNKLTIKVQKSVLNTSGSQETFNLLSVELKKTTSTSGFYTENGFVLGQNYIYNF